MLKTKSMSDASAMPLLPKVSASQKVTANATIQMPAVLALMGDPL
ncbi:MAG: hypothetical protein WBP22_01885 [Candidatus Saccharimonas sp.]